MFKRHGKTLWALQSFLRAVQAGKSALIIGVNYVVMSRHEFDLLMEGQPKCQLSLETINRRISTLSMSEDASF